MYRNNVVLGVCVSGLFMVTPGQQADYEKLLTIEEVESVTGIEGIKLVPRNPQIGAGGELNFALADGSMVLMVGIQDAPMCTTSGRRKKVSSMNRYPTLGTRPFRGRVSASTATF